MEKLSKTGQLSMSDAQTLSNLCNQKSLDIQRILSSLNNASKSVSIDGKEREVLKGNKIPENIEEILLNKARYHSFQAYLMECIKLKESLLEEAKNSEFHHNIETPKLHQTKLFIPSERFRENDALSLLTVDEHIDYLVNEAFAAHIGKFIHKNGELDKLREEIHSINLIEWVQHKKDERLLVNINVHHSPEDLNALHDKLVKIHRDHEKKVNYYKAMMKNRAVEKNRELNLEDEKNRVEILSFNRKVDNENKLIINEYENKVEIERLKFNTAKGEKLKEISTLKIVLPKVFEDLAKNLLG